MEAACVPHKTDLHLTGCRGVSTTYGAIPAITIVNHIFIVHGPNILAALERE